ncbi:hypothetical protein ABE169_06545 [Bacillus subtilis]
MIQTIDVSRKNIIVLGYSLLHARNAWYQIKSQYAGFEKVSFVADKKERLAGLNPADTVIIAIGQVWRIPIFDSWEFRFLKENGAVFIQVK